MSRVRVRPMILFSMGFTISAGAAWYAAGDLSAGPAAGSAAIIGMIRAAAVALTILAGMCWLEVRRDRGNGGRRPTRAEMLRREEVLIRTINSLAEEREPPVRHLNSA